MNTLLMGLEAQPDYPAKDLTDSNAELLSLMLANDSLVLGGHVQAEASIQAFRLLHPTATTSANRVFDDHDRVAAHGRCSRSGQRLGLVVGRAGERVDGTLEVLRATGVCQRRARGRAGSRRSVPASASRGEQQLTRRCRR